MNEPLQKALPGPAGFGWSRLSNSARREIGFWAVVAGMLFFMFHLHGNSQEVATCRHSLFLWLRSRWQGETLALS